MGHRKLHAPRHGSLGVRPRKRAEELTPSVRTWPEKTWFELLLERASDAASLGITNRPVLLGYAMYKAGMTHGIIVEDRPGTPYSGKEVFAPVTIVEAPPMIILGLRTYEYDDNGYLRTRGEVWRSPVDAVIKSFEKYYANNPLLGLTAKEVVRKYLHGLRKVNHGLVKPDPQGEYGYKFVAESGEDELKEALSGDVARVSVIASTLPILTGIGKKKPEIVEVKVGGGSSIDEQLKYAESVLGGYVTAFDVFREGQFVDVIGVTKGRGFQGVVKRFGVKELPRWHKHRKGSRKIGSRSPGFGTMSEPPQPGQMGFHRRTEYNKRILKMGENGAEVTYAGGVLHYGLVYGPYVLVKGSLLGPSKRMLIFRHPVRPHLKWLPLASPKIVYLSLESKQGA